MLRKGRLARLTQLGGIAAGLAGDVATATAGLATQKADSASKRFHLRAAKRLAASMGEMKALPMKVGQLLSYIDEVIPVEHRQVYAEILGQLQAGSQPLPWDEVVGVLTDDLGKPPDELFASVSHHPIAAASIGQVYRAVTLDSQDVAVKVQYPGVAEALDSDLNNAEMIVKALTAVMPNSDLSHFITDMEDRLHEEVDYRREAENTSRFRSNWAGDERVVLPAVLPELSGERVLTTTWLHGDRWDEMMVLADGPLRAQYGVLIYRFVLQSLYRHGMFNGDPHPGNYLFFPDGRVGFLDFGHVQIYDQAGRQAFCDVRDAVLDGKRGSALRPWIDEAFGMPDNLDDELWELAERYLLLTLEPLVAPQPYRFTPEYPKRLAKLTIDAKMVWMRKALFRGVKDASRPGVVVASRLNFGLPSILAKLGAEADWRAML